MRTRPSPHLLTATDKDSPRIIFYSVVPAKPNRAPLPCVTEALPNRKAETNSRKLQGQFDSTQSANGIERGIFTQVLPTIRHQATVEHKLTRRLEITSSDRYH